MYHHLILAAHHAHSWQNGPMNAHWLAIGLVFAIVGAVLISLAKKVA